MKWYLSTVALLATLAVAAPAPQQKAANGVNDAANNGEGVSARVDNPPPLGTTAGDPGRLTLRNRASRLRPRLRLLSSSARTAMVSSCFTLNITG